MSFLKLIKEKGSKKIKELKELRYEDPFAVSIDDCDSAVIDAKEIIPPGDDGFGDDEKPGVMSN